MSLPAFTQLVLPIHPMMVHFPIALLLAALALDCVGLILKKDRIRQAALPVLALAVLGGIVAAITGDMAHDAITRMTTELHELIEAHEIFAFSTLGWAVVALALRIWAEYKKALQGLWGYLSLAALVVAAIMVSITGYFGGEIVFKYGVGTSQYEKLYQGAPSQPEHGEHTHE